MPAILQFLLLFFFLLPAPDPRAQDIVPGDNLVLDGIPKIPQSIANEIGRYSEFRRARFVDWHPVRKEMLIQTRLGNTNQLHQVKFPGGARTQVTFYDDPVFSGRYEPVRGRYLVFRKDIGGDERYQNYRYDFTSGTTTLLSDGKSRNDRGRWSRDGRRLAYMSTRRNGRDQDLYVIDPLEPKSDHLVAELQGGGWSVSDWSPDGRRVVMLEEISINECYLWMVDLASGRKELITAKGKGVKVVYDQAVFSKDGQGLWVATDADSEFRRLAYLDLRSAALRPLRLALGGEIEEFDVSPDGSKLAVVANEDGWSRLYLVEPASGKSRRLNLPAGVLDNVKWHRSGRYLGFTLSSARLPSEAFSLDLQTGNVERWTYSETGGLRTERFVEPELVRWKSFDGLSISGFLYRPAGKFTGKRPVVIDIHGGPESQFRPGFLGSRNYYLNELGVAILFPNIRGSTGYGKTFLTLDNGTLRTNAYKDIETLLDWLSARPDIDPNRVLVTGGSYGGHMSLAVSYLYSERLACSVDIVGPSNLVTFLETTADYRRDLRRVEYGDERDAATRAFLERTAPMNNVDRIRKPIFIVQGRNDPRVPLSEAEQMVAALKKNGTPVWYLMAKDEGHGFGKKKNADFQFYATVSFMKSCLLE